MPVQLISVGLQLLQKFAFPGSAFSRCGRPSARAKTVCGARPKTAYRSAFSLPGKGAYGKRYVLSLSDALGFADQGSFSKFFRRLAGMSHSEYRNSIKNDDDIQDGSGFVNAACNSENK